MDGTNSNRSALLWRFHESRASDKKFMVKIFINLRAELQHIKSYHSTTKNDIDKKHSYRAEIM